MSSGALTRAMHTLDELALPTSMAAEANTAIASAASSTTTVVLAGIGLMVTIGLAVIGWIIVGRRRNKDRAADVDNDDLNELIRLLRDTDIEVRRIASQPHPADRGDFREIERLTPPPREPWRTGRRLSGDARGRRRREHESVRPAIHRRQRPDRRTRHAYPTADPSNRQSPGHNRQGAHQRTADAQLTQPCAARPPSSIPYSGGSATASPRVSRQSPGGRDS